MRPPPPLSLPDAATDLRVQPQDGHLPPVGKCLPDTDARDVAVAVGRSQLWAQVLEGNHVGLGLALCMVRAVSHAWGWEKVMMRAGS